LNIQLKRILFKEHLESLKLKSEESVKALWFYQCANEESTEVVQAALKNLYDYQANLEKLLVAVPDIQHPQ
jgi:phage terminase large subunit